MSLRSHRSAGTEPRSVIVMGALFVLMIGAPVVACAVDAVSGVEATGTSAAAISPQSQIQVASGGHEHLWFSMRRGTTAAMLLHIAKTMEPGVVREGPPLPGPPTAIASWEDRAYLLFPPRSAVMPRPYMLSTQAKRNPATGLWFSSPADRLELLPLLPSEAPVESVVAGVEGPHILFVGGHELWQLKRSVWTPLALPEELAVSANRRLSPIERGADILATTASGGGWERWLHDGDAWNRTALGVPSTAAVFPLGGTPPIALVEDHERRIVRLDSEGVVTLARLDHDASIVTRLGNEPVLLDDDGDLRLRRVNPTTGEISPEVKLLAQRSLASTWYHLPVLGALAVAILMIVFFVRSLGQEGSQQLAPEWEPLPFAVRVAALGIDLIPGIVAAKTIFGTSWSSVLLLPSFVTEVDLAVPSLTALLIAVGITAVTEMIFDRSIGKLLVGARVVSTRLPGPSRPSFLQHLARNVFKAVVLQMPPLAIFTLLNPLRQGVGEMVSGTAVVRRRGLPVPAPGT